MEKYALYIKYKFTQYKIYFIININIDIYLMVLVTGKGKNAFVNYFITTQQSIVVEAKCKLLCECILNVKLFFS